jgi:hypothetical protein
MTTTDASESRTRQTRTPFSRRRDPLRAPFPRRADTGERVRRLTERARVELAGARLARRTRGPDDGAPPNE